MRRSIAWAAHIPDQDLPPIDDNYVVLFKPRAGRPKIYINNNELFNKMFSDKSIIIGDINITWYVPYPRNINKVEFYIDDTLEKTINKSELPENDDISFKLTKKLLGLHKISVISYGKYGTIAWDDSIAWFFNL